MFVNFKSNAKLTVYLYYSSHSKYLTAFKNIKKMHTSSFLFLRAPKHFKVGKQIAKRTHGLCRYSFYFNVFSLHTQIPKQVTYLTLVSLARIYSGYGIYLKHFKLTYALKLKL